MSPEMGLRLAKVKKKALVSDKGSRFFIELSYYPIISLWVTSGDMKPDVSNERELHLRYVYENETYLPLNTMKNRAIQ